MFVGREAKTMSPCLLVTQPVHDAIPDNAQYFFTSLTICADMHLQTNNVHASQVLHDVENYLRQVIH
jgi:hypothetical protein